MTDQEHHFSGVHVLGELYGVSSDKLNDIQLLQSAIEAGIKRSGATLCSIQVKQFEPSGVTILALLSESHASIHTYPSQGALFFDAFTCGEFCDPREIAHQLSESLNPAKSTLKVVQRGERIQLAFNPEKPVTFSHIS